MLVIFGFADENISLDVAIPPGGDIGGVLHNMKTDGIVQLTSGRFAYIDITEVLYAVPAEDTHPYPDTFQRAMDSGS